MTIKHKRIFLAFLTAAASSMVIVVSLFKNNIYGADGLFKMGNNESYSISFNSSKNKFHNNSDDVGYDGISLIKTNLNNDIEFTYYQIVGGGLSTWHEIKPGGYFYNNDAIHGLENISISFNSDHLKFDICYSVDTGFDYVKSFFSSDSEPIVFDFDGILPHYFKIINTEGVNLDISSIEVNLNCADSYRSLSSYDVNTYYDLLGQQCINIAGKFYQDAVRDDEEYSLLAPFCNSIEEFEAIKTFTLDLTKDATTDTAKAQIIYDWVHDNIEWDDGYAFDNPYDCFVNQKGVCSQFAQLIHEMFSSVGIVSFYVQARVCHYPSIEAYYNDNSNTYRHAISLAYLDGDWKFFDGVWGFSFEDVDYVSDRYVIDSCNYVNTLPEAINRYEISNDNIVSFMKHGRFFGNEFEISQNGIQSSYYIPGKGTMKNWMGYIDNNFGYYAYNGKLYLVRDYLKYLCIADDPYLLTDFADDHNISIDNNYNVFLGGIDGNTFWYSDNDLNKSVYLKSDEAAFLGSLVFNKDLVIPDTIDGLKVVCVTDIDVSNLESLYIGNNVISLGSLIHENYSPYLYQSSLRSLYIGDNLGVDIKKFNIEKSLDSITIGENNIKLKVIDNVVYSFDLTHLYLYPCGLENVSFVIPNEVTTIECSLYNEYLKSISMSDNVVEITGDFQCCYALESLRLSNSLSKLGDTLLLQKSSEVYTKYGDCLYLGNEINPYLVCEGVVDYDHHNSIVIQEGTKFIHVALNYQFDCDSLSIPDSIISFSPSCNFNSSCFTIQNGVYYLGNTINPYTVLVKVDSSITSINIPTQTKLIYYGAFSSVNHLDSFTINSDCICDGNAFGFCNIDNMYILVKNVKLFKTFGYFYFQGISYPSNRIFADNVYYIGTEEEFNEDCLTIFGAPDLGYYLVHFNYSPS